MLEILIFILITFFGYLLTNLIIKDIRFLERLALSYLLGIGLTTVLVFLYSWVGVKITLLSVISLVITLIVPLGIVHKLLGIKLNLRGLNIFKTFGRFKWYEKILCLIIFILLLLSVILSSYYPVAAWDALALYDFVAKVISHTGFFVQIANQFYYFAEYPLLVSLTHTIVYLSKGTNPQFIYSLYYISFAILCFSFIRRYLNRFLALFFTLIIISDPTLFAHSAIAYTNLPYTVYFVAGIFYLFYGLTNDRYDYLFISSLLIGLSTWVRSAEPFWFAGILFVVAYSIFKKKIYPVLIYLPAFLIIQQPWKIIQASLYGNNYATSTQFVVVGKTLLPGGINMAQIADVINYIYQNIILSWKLVFPAFIIAILLNLIKANKRALLFLAIILANFAALFIGVYYFSLNFPNWKVIGGSATRLAIFFPPLMICYSALVLSTVFETIRKNENRN